MRRLKREFLRPSMARGCEREGRSCAVSRGGAVGERLGAEEL